MAIFDKKNAIKIEEDDLNDAKLSSLDFDNLSIRKRAFINVLGARIAMKMLFSKKIEANNVYSLYTIHNVLEDLDIADVYVQDIKIDVRLVFDRNEIFIPKKHFELDILPDLYLVLQLKEDFSCAEPLGFFEPKDLNKANHNSDFYFYDCEELNNVKDLKTFLKNYSTNPKFEVSEENFEKAETLFLSLADKEISEDDKFFLCQQLTNSVTLREKFVEFENFEIISKETAKNDSLLQDGVLDIVGAQQVFEDESANATQAEVKAEVIGEVLSDLILDENKITDVTEEEPTHNKEDDEDFINELLGKTSEEEEEDNNKSNTDLITGMAIGGAIAGGITAAGASAMAEGNAIKSSLDAIAAGIDLTDNLIEKGLDTASNAFESADDFLESLIEQEIKPEQELEIETEHIEEIETINEETKEEIFNIEDLDFTTLDNDVLSEISLDEEPETTVEQEQEILQEFSFDQVEDLLSEEIEDLPETKPEDELSMVAEIDAILEESPIDFGQLEELPSEIESLPELGQEIEEETNLESENIELESTEEIFSEDKVEIKPGQEENIELEKDLNEIEEIAVSSNQTELEEIEALTEIEPLEELSESTELSSNIEEADLNKEDSELSGLISSLPDIDGLISSGEFDFENIKEKVDEVLFEEKPNFEAFGINEEDLKKEISKFDVEPARETSEEFIQPENISLEPISEDFTDTENTLFGSSDDAIGGLPKLDIEGFSEKQNEGISNKEKEFDEENKSVFNLDDFDFNLLNDGEEADFKDYDAAAEEAESIKKKIQDEDFDYESIERQIEEEEEKEKSAKEAPLESEIDDTDDFLSQVDDFLNDIDNADSNLDLSEVDKTLLENTLNSFDQNEIFDTSSFISATTTDDTEQEATNDTEDDETLQLLFKNKGIGGDGNLGEKEILPSIRKDKKMVIAASIASVVLVSAVIGVGIINNNKSNNMINKPEAVQNMPQDMPTQNADMNTDLSQQVPDLADATGQQNALSGEPQQMDANRDMGQAVSDAFTSEPINATISKVAWEVPEDLAYNDGFRSYLQIAGKNLKLNLQNNLLLATEMAYSNKVIVNLTITRDGSLQSSNIARSSGSKQIDNIVLQSVKETLMYLKMPSSELRGKSVNATLIINF